MLLVPGLAFTMDINDSVMHRNVNVVTGKIQLSFQDHVVQGAVPLVLQRSYTNYEVTKEKYPKGDSEKRAVL
ncbi:MAG: hypothetical protein SP4CHLAM5_04930 [Chlamydiia bacterium]|nr:hypothetical protein [Chlamydiia bacterium]MCH9618364.1 hypothetical protein [Chlamydiia bacterium]